MDDGRPDAAVLHKLVIFSTYLMTLATVSADNMDTACSLTATMVSSDIRPALLAGESDETGKRE